MDIGTKDILSKDIATNLPLAGSLAIGSTPFLDPTETLDELAALDIPAAPQMVKASFFEDMIFGAIDGLGFLVAQPEKRRVVVDEDNLGESLARFYELYAAGDYAFLDPGPRSSRGLRAFLDRARRDPSFGPEFLKAQVVGPLTLAQSLRLANGAAAVTDLNLLEALSLGLGAKAARLASQIRELGRAAVVFIDEPGLTGYGSAFSSLSSETVLTYLGQAVSVAKSSGPVWVGCHVCGNTDWGLLAQTGLDILNFDAFSHLEAFCLYPREIAAFLEKGGWIAWGITPTEAYEPGLTARGLLERLWAGVKPLTRQIDRALLAQRSLYSTSCGLGSLEPERARAILALLAEVGQLAKAEFS
ncbi:MAG: hypothetical protein LBR11_09630 [Deltaproteobacteria bacterium]|nr:hypothetical protein [Deltaproteobacteria bacterium]